MALNVHQPHTIYTRTLWNDEWVAVPYLYANTFSFACGPDTSDAELEYSYGRKIRPGLMAYANYLPLTLTDKYIKIVVDNGPTWFGICIDQQDDREGGFQPAGQGAEIATGKQMFICRGMEYLLQRTPIISSWVQDSDSNTGDTEVGRGIAFNLGAGLPSSADRQGNRSEAPSGHLGGYIFAESLQDAVEWHADDILFYLTKYFRPKDRNGLVRIPIFFRNFAGASQILNPYKPTLHCDGKSIFEILNDIIDRRRLISWYLYIDPADELLQIDVFTLTNNLIALPGGGIVPLNPTSLQAAISQWNLDQENQVQRFTLATDAAANYHKVICRGEPPGSCFTVEMAGGGGNAYLEIDWTTAQQTTYLAGATATAAGAAHYGGLSDDWAKHNAHQAARTKDSLKKVFRYFRVSPTQFTGTIGASAVWPYDNDPANVAVPLSFWWPGIRLQDKLPLRLEHDYQNVAAVTDAMRTSSKWEYQRPFAYFKNSDNDKYFFCDRHGRGESVDTHIEATGRHWSANLRMQDDAFGIIVDVSGGPQHMIAANTFVANDAADETDYVPDVDYNYLAATVFAENDGRVTVQWPPQNQINVNPDVLKELYIDVPHARLDYLVPGTVIDIDDKGDRVLTEGGFVRDDTNFMRNVARCAYEWYKQTRKAMQITIHDLAVRRSRGDYILVVNFPGNHDVVNSCVTKISFDTLAGTATYFTQFAELDVNQ